MSKSNLTNKQVLLIYELIIILQLKNYEHNNSSVEEDLEKLLDKYSSSMFLKK